MTNREEWNKFSHLYSRLDIPSKTTLLREGQVSKMAYYIEKGCIRSWFNHNGKDITFQFFFESEGVSSVESFRTNQASLFTLESLEPCTLLCISKNDFTFILENSPRIKAEVEAHTFKRLVYYQQLFLSRIRDNPQTRYEELIRQRPEILQRIPQHYIASYLGITPVSLSRIRNRR
ncbi:Crp/Fnr family transcriptional regulator [Marinilongibacter aquaticus]|uniref:Crp/Fnr family transcriptional regulator n=1 Tax=Marinilongibacter aquaticus TaxID=2975157 RepID=UPI0021BD8E07|nr:Crp/Fnr family transcriptional regulator [Marinilongibacter aquaticus]UBM59628.1 Crp/Fnr family transcriptional regulator [Marinilongibacter aquaticus]